MDIEKEIRKLHDNKLTEVTLVGWEIEPHLEEIKAALNKNSSLKSLEIRHSSLGEVEKLLPVLLDHPTIKEITFFDCTFLGEKLPALSEFIRLNRTLVDLRFEQSRFNTRMIPESKTIQALADAIADNKTLLALSFKGTNLDEPCINILAEMLHKHQTIAGCNMDRIKMNDRTQKNLAWTAAHKLSLIYLGNDKFWELQCEDNLKHVEMVIEHILEHPDIKSEAGEVIAADVLDNKLSGAIRYFVYSHPNKFDEKKRKRIDDFLAAAEAINIQPPKSFEIPPDLAQNDEVKWTNTVAAPKSYLFDPGPSKSSKRKR